MKDKKRDIKKDQLLPEREFIHFCNNDRANNHAGSRMSINESFLQAVKKDGLIKPILQIEGVVKNPDGTEKQGLIDYYSPHQFFIIAALRKNIVDEDDNLQSSDTRDWYAERPKEERPRYIAWGQGMSFWADAPRKNEDEMDIGVDVHLLSDYFHDFLQFLHTFETVAPHEARQRYWRTPQVNEYNFDELKTSKNTLLNEYGLDEKKIKILRKNVGQFAETIDPLAHWHYYIQKHPEWRRDLLKGDASSAQDIYRLYDLLTEVWEIVMDKKSASIFEFLYEDFHHPMYTPKSGYLHGEDTRALLYSIEQFEKWSNEEDNKQFVSKETLDEVKLIEKALKDFENRYGDKSYAGSLRRIGPENSVKIKDLDDVTKRYVEMILSQLQRQGETVTEEETKTEISRAIMSRLSDIQRDLRDTFRSVSNQFNDKENAAWQEINGSDLWMKLAREGRFKDLDRAQQIQLANEERNKIKKEADFWKEKSKEFHRNVSWYADLAFCKECRKNPILLHKENDGRDQWDSFMPCICDDCISSSKDLRQLTAGHWDCDYCGKKIYNFAHGNMLSDVLINRVPTTIKLDYGRMEIEVTCNDRSCNKKQWKVIDWGWLP